jgi:hypothetical protein
VKVNEGRQRTANAGIDAAVMEAINNDHGAITPLE